MTKIKTAYLSGPISGLVNGNYDNFLKAQKKLEKEGYVVLNPHEIGKDIYNKWSKLDFTSKEKEQERWKEFMKEDIKYLLTCDCVFLLDNWETSPGATLELLIAQKLGIPIYYIKTFAEFDHTFQITKLSKMPV